MPSIKLGQRMRKARETRKLIQEELAHKIQEFRRLDHHIKEAKQTKLDQATISDWENGYQTPSPNNIHLVARALELTYEEEIYWLGLAGHLAPTPVPTKAQIIPILEVYCE